MKFNKPFVLIKEKINQLKLKSKDESKRFRFKLKHKTKNSLIGYSFILLWIIGFVVLTLYPLVNSIIYSFNDIIIGTNGITMTYVGLGNYREILSKDLNFVNALMDFAVELLLNVPVIVVISIIIAVLLNQNIRFRGVFRSIYFLPVIITSGPVINELMAQGATTVPILERYGVLQVISNNLNPQIAEPIITLFSQIIMVLWFSGVQILIFLAGLQKIDQQVYEAARIDGASPWESFWKVTLPSLKNLVVINIIYTIVTLSTFSENKVITEITGNMFDPNRGYGYATATAWIYFILVFFALLISVGLVLLSGKNKYQG